MKRNLITVLLAMVILLGTAACAAQGNTGDNMQGSDVPDAGALQAAAPALACPVNMIPDAENNYPYMGLSVQFPDRLLSAVLDNIVFMRADEDLEYIDLPSMDRVPANWRPSAENMLLHGGCLELLFLPEGMRERTPHRGMANAMTYEEYEGWVAGAVPMARLGMYRKAELEESMLEANGYAEHRKLGESAEYVYYLSVNEAADALTQEGKDLFALLDSLEKGIAVFEPRPIDDDYFGLATPKVDAVSSIGNFQTETLDGERVDQTVFSDAKLTMVNVWTTWCGACIEEMPDLDELSKELQDSGIQILSIVDDVCDARGTVNGEMLELARKIRERTGVSFPVLIPDSNLKNHLLKGILGYPTTWFVDSRGNVVGEPVLGSNSKEEWTALIQERLAEVDQ